MSGVFWQYNGDSLYLAAFAASLGFLCWKQKNCLGSIGKKAAAALLFAVIFVFNEFAYRFVGKLTDATTYYRFFWMLPVLFLIAYQLTVLVTSGNKTKMIAAAVILIVCLGFGANFFFLNRQNLNRPKNIYGLDPDTVTVAEQIMADWDTSGSNESDKGKEQPTAAFDMYLEYQVRTYEPRILWGISRKAYLYQAEHGYDNKKYTRQQPVIAAVNEGIQNDSAQLRKCIDKIGIDYLVIRTVFDMDSYLSGISVLPIAQSENYTLYKVE